MDPAPTRPTNHCNSSPGYRCAPEYLHWPPGQGCCASAPADSICFGRVPNPIPTLGHRRCLDAYESRAGNAVLLNKNKLSLTIQRVEEGLPATAYIDGERIVRSPRS